MPIMQGENVKSFVEVTIEDGRVCVTLSRYGICLERRSFSAQDLIEAGFATQLLNSNSGTLDTQYAKEKKNDDA